MRFAAALVAALLLAACDRAVGRLQGGDAAPLLDVPRQVVWSGPLLAVPGPRWDRHPPADGGWRFRAFARILCLVREAASDPLVFELRPDESLEV